MFGLSFAQIIVWAIAHQSQIAAVTSAVIKYGPQVAEIVRKGKPVIDAVKQVAPDIVPDLRKLAGAALGGMRLDDADFDKFVETVATGLFAPQELKPQDPLFNRVDYHT